MTDIIDPDNPDGIGQMRPSQGTSALSKREPFSGMDRVYEQMEVWLRDREPHRVWAEQSVRSVNYIRGIQWDAETLAYLQGQGRPALTFNRIRPLHRLLIGYYLQNRSDIRYLPGNDAISTAETAEAISKTVKQIDEETFYRWRESSCFIDGLSSGRAFMEVRLGFEQNLFGTVTQEDIDPFQVYVDADAGAYDISRHNHVTINKYLSLEDVAMTYGGERAKEIIGRFSNSMTVAPEGTMGEGLEDELTPERYFGLNDYLRNGSNRFQYISGVSTMVSDHVDRQRKILRVLDRQHKKMKRVRMMVDYQTGDKIVIPDHWTPERISYVIQMMATKGWQFGVVDEHVMRWRWTVTCLDTVLYDDWSPYEEPTMLGFFPYFERGITPSFAADLMDPQDEVNKRRSALVHAVMSGANPGWMYEEGTLEPEYEDALETSGARPGIILKFRRPRPDSQPPRRIEPGMPPAGLRLLETEAKNDMNEISGVNQSAMGLVDKVQSGRAIEARQRQAIVTHEQAFDNMKQMRELRGRKILQLVQGFYTQQRLVRIIGDDGTDVMSWINAMTVAGNLINDVTQGRYRISIDETPMSATFQAAQFDEMMAMVEKGLLPPQMADILIELSTVPRKQEIIQRLRMMQGMMQPGMPPGAPGAPSAGPGAMGGAPPMGLGPPGVPPMGGMAGGPALQMPQMPPSLPTTAMPPPRMPGLPGSTPIIPGDAGGLVAGPGGALMRPQQ